MVLGRTNGLVEYTLYRLLKEGRRNGFGVTERGEKAFTFLHRVDIGTLVVGKLHSSADME